MKITIRILFISLLFYTNSYANISSKKLNITFEMMKGKLEYMDILEYKKAKFSKLGLKCYIFKVPKGISLRCNDTKTTKDYNANLKLLESLNLKYKVISIEKYKVKSTLKKSVNKPILKKTVPILTLEDGYKAYKNKSYTKANLIFLKLYKKNQNLENSYALALVAFQRKKFEITRKYILKYKNSSKKSATLFYNSIVDEYKMLIKTDKKKKAEFLKKKYIKEYPKLEELWVLMFKYNLEVGYKAFNKKQFKKAERIFTKLYKRDANLENAFAMGLIFFQKKQYKKVRLYIKPFRTKKEKVSTLYYDSIVNEYYALLEQESNQKAVALQKKYIKQYPKLKQLQKPKVDVSLKDGYEFYEQKKYKQAKTIFLKLYKYEKNLENSYALSLIFLQEKKYKRVRKLLAKYRVSDKKVSKLYYDSIVTEYYSYIKVKRATKALALQKEFIILYPALQYLEKPKPKYTLKQAYDAYYKNEKDKALFMFSFLYQKEDTLDNAYGLGFIYFQNKNYSDTRKYLKKYIGDSDKVSKLFYDSIVSEYYSYVNAGRNSRALELKNRYINLYPELATLIKPTPIYTLKEGYEAYNRKDYEKANFIFSKLYRTKNSLENSYAMGLIMLQSKEYLKTREYLYRYKKESAKVEQLYYNSIIEEYNSYMNKKEYIKAIVLLKQFKREYPQLKKMDKALIIKAKLFIEDGEYYKAEELLRDNDFKNTQDMLFEGIYTKALKLQKDNKEIEALKMILPYLAYYRKAVKFYLDISFRRAKKYLQNKNYVKAKNLLKPIVVISSKAQEFYYKVIYEENLNAGWDSFHAKDYENSLTYFENACEVSHQYNCIEGIMHSAYKLQNNDVKALAAAEEVYEYTESQESIFIAYNSAYNLEDSKKSDFWYNLLELQYKKLVIFNMQLDNGQDVKVDEIYIDAINDYPEDFELAVKYLYLLKDSKRYIEFEKFMENSQYNFETPLQKDILARINREYKNRKLTKYYENEEYNKCYIYGKKILTEEDEVEYKRMHAWCAFKSEHYKDAQKIFENINLKYGRTVEDTDAQFLSAFNDKNYDKAFELLKIVNEYTTDEYEFEKQADFFISMNYLKEASDVTLDILDKETRDKLKFKIKESYQYNRNKVSLSANGFHYSKRSIEDGLHSFTQYYIPMDIDIYDETYGHLYIDADILYLYDEFQGSNELNTLTYGLGSNYNENKTSSNTTFLPNAGIETEYMTFELGSTPLGADIVPKLMGAIAFHGSYQNLNMNLKFLRKGDNDSMLSSVGENLDAKGREIKWGRAFKSGVELDMSYNSIISYGLSFSSYPTIEGHHIKDNAQTKAVASMSYSADIDSFTYLNYSFIAVYDTYDFNSDLFTYGHGGYFSPQDFLLGNFIVDIANIVNDDFYWKFKISLGYENFTVDDVTQYPVLDANSEGLYGEVQGYKEQGFTYKINLASSYRLSRNLDMIGAVSYEQMYKFKDISAGFSFVYSFDKKHKVNLYNFHDGHRLKESF